jgi:hypothetical protein
VFPIFCFLAHLTLLDLGKFTFVPKHHRIEACG